jgi:hypothetical protein
LLIACTVTCFVIIGVKKGLILYGRKSGVI